MTSPPVSCRSPWQLAVVVAALLSTAVPLNGCGAGPGPEGAAPPAVATSPTVVELGADPAHDGGPVAPAHSDPRLKVIGIRVAGPTPSPDGADSLFASRPGLGDGGTSVHFALSEEKTRFLGIDSDRSRIHAFRDDRGTDLLDEHTSVRQMRATSKQRSTALFTVHSNRLPAAGARSIRIKAEVALLVAAQTHTHTATLAPGSSAEVDVGVGTLRLERRDGGATTNPFGNSTQPARPVTAVTCEGVEAIDGHLGTLSLFDASAGSASPPLPSRGTGTTIINGKRTMRYMIDETQQPLRVEIPVSIPKTETVTVDLEVGLGLTSAR